MSLVTRPAAPILHDREDMTMNAATPSPDAPVRVSPQALEELGRLFPGDDVRHVRVIATPG